MNDTQFIYRVRINEYGGVVEVGIWDPDRWDGEGGVKFGFDATLYVNEPRGYRGETEWTVEVQQGGLGSHSPDEADKRISCYQQVAEIGRFILDAFDRGETMEQIADFLSQNLPQDEPASTPFKRGEHGDWVVPR